MQIKLDIHIAAQEAAWDFMVKSLHERGWFTIVNWVNLSEYDNIEHLLKDIEQPYTSVELLAQIDKDITTVEEIANVADLCVNHPCEKVLLVSAAGYVYNFYAIGIQYDPFWVINNCIFVVSEEDDSEEFRKQSGGFNFKTVAQKDDWVIQKDGLYFIVCDCGISTLYIFDNASIK